jgi:catechol 2,3-dioxygenase-like lactoylglutathione lyase family enzyme
MTTAEERRDERPAVWVGHVRVTAADVAAASRFWQTIGMRPVFERDDFSVLELRGGTHLVIVAGDAGSEEIGFDIMVDDLQATWKLFNDAGLNPTPVTEGTIHSSFTVLDPAGRALTINSSHVVGPV